MEFRTATDKVTGFIASALSRRQLWLFLAIISIFGVVDVPTTSSYHYSELFILLWLLGTASLKSAVICVIFQSVRRYRLLKTGVYFLTGIYAVLCLTNLVCWFFYDFGIGCRFFIVAGQTTATEIKEFLPGLLSNFGAIISSVWFCAIVAAAVLTFIFIKRLGRRIYNICVASLSLLGIVMLAIFLSQQLYGRSDVLMSVRFPRSLHQVRSATRQWEAMMESKQIFPVADAVKSEHRANTVLLVLGESASRNHHSLYGYPLATTPLLDEIKDSLIVFKDAIASASYTAGNMENILTFKPDTDIRGSWTSYPSLVDLFRTAGYKFFWLSNQERIGTIANSATVLSSSADVIEFAGAEMVEDTKNLRYDEVLVPYIEKALTDTAENKFIVAHLLGSHTQYKKRFPEEFAYFTEDSITATPMHRGLTSVQAAVVADYDNSIRYTDYLLGKWINEISHSSQPALLIYFSDHGENVYDFDDMTGRSVRSVEVPLIIYANSAYKAANPEFIEKIKAATDRPISTANIIHALMSLTGTEYPNYDESRDFLSDKYVVRTRFVDNEEWPYEHILN